jgi:hypothetical protein
LGIHKNSQHTHTDTKIVVALYTALDWPGLAQSFTYSARGYIGGRDLINHWDLFTHRSSEKKKKGKSKGENVVYFFTY